MGNFAEVTGVLRYNDETRNEMLRRIYWKDKIYTTFGGNFVRYANISDRNVEPVMGGVALQIVSDAKRAEEGKINIYANDDRYLVQKYLTPALVNFYGSSPGLNTKLFKYTFGQYYTGRISEIEEADVKFENDYLDYLFSDGQGNPIETIDENTLQSMDAPKRHMYGMLIDASKLTGKNYFADNERYITFLQTINNGVTKERGIIANEREFIDDGFKIYEYRNRYWQNYAHETNFSEGDVSYNEPAEMLHEEGADTSFREPSFKAKSLLSKTNDLFRAHKISTLAARFHTSGEISDEPELTDTAKSKGYGNSHGRNLLKKKPTLNSDTNGYDNPYCRVWTYHHQYDRMSRLIRPFDTTEGEVHDADPYIADFGTKASDGRTYLKNNTVLGKNGMVKIAPKGDACGNLTTEIKNCMFSIENLAWKDVPRNMGYISKEQRGPNGGRIMWFPPYDLDFNENVSVNWNQSTFIGRGEPVFTYNNTNRQGTLSFAILIDHPSIIDNIPKYNLNPTEDGNDLDADVLRFFAGCQIPDLKKESPDCLEEPKEVVSEQVPGDEPKLEKPEQEKAKHTKFYVYFPNNYSGNSVKVSKADWAANGSSDRAWFDYLLYGVDTVIGNASSPGYERNGVGVTTSNDIEANSIKVNAKYAAWETGSGTVENVAYKYLVDFDLHEKLYNRLPGQDLYTRGMTFTPNDPLNSSNYTDATSFRLNSELTNNPTDATHSFLQIIASMYKAFPEAFAGTNLDKFKISESYIDNELVSAFKEGRFDRVEVKAGATRQDSANSKTLAERRYRSVMNLLMDFGAIGKDKFTEPSLIYDDHLVGETTVNSLETKKQRFASVEMWYDTPEIQKMSDTTHPTYDSLIEDNGEVAHYSDNIEAASVVATRPVSVAATEGGVTGRYETEAEYFRDIEKTHPFIYRSLVEKFKYFSPAYHSISPEGFNARLTFLQQCTRQGHTISATDLNYARTAGNLSFGRMPVCVLRIGDFINTKIIIQSMSINYGASGAPQWDLNPEGIGVQPMYAKVQLGIVILGGQSLEGPINRLQNAVSFNYYANTGVYDNRSDRAATNIEKKVFNGDGETVREMTVETSGDKVHVNVWDDSEYGITKTNYSHIWTPYPNVNVKDDEKNLIGTYNEYKSRGIHKDSDGRYKLN